MKLSSKKHDIRKFRDCIRSYSDKRDVETRQKFAFLLISANKYTLCLGIQTYFFMKQQLSFYKSLKFQQYTSIESKIIGILVKSVMKTADVSKLFLAIFEWSFYVTFFAAAACLC